MAWIKRNLFIALSAAIGLALLGGAGFFVYSNWSDDAAATDELSQVLAAIDAAKQKKPQPSPALVQQAKESQNQLRSILDKFKNTSVAATNDQIIDPKAFKLALDSTITQLGTAATNSGVRLLGSDFSFTFGSLLLRMDLPTNCLNAWNGQLQDIKDLCGVVYNSRVNSLESIRRPSISVDEASSGGQSDFLNLPIQTNGASLRIPYEVCVQAYSRELAELINGLSQPTNHFIIRNLDIGPAAGSSGAISTGATGTGASTAAAAPAVNRIRTGASGASTAAAGTTVTANPGPATLVSEGLVRAVILVDSIKPIAVPAETPKTKATPKN